MSAETAIVVMLVIAAALFVLFVLLLPGVLLALFIRHTVRRPTPPSPSPSTIRIEDDTIPYMDEAAGEVAAGEVVAPLFRSAAQFRILGELFTLPGAEYTIGELVERTGAAQATVSREVATLTAAGILQRREEGNRTLVSARPDSVIAPELRAMMAKLYGPVAALRRALGEVDGVERVSVFGSFAERWSGGGGPVPRDVDVLIVGEVDHDRIWTIAARLSRELGIEINPVIRTADEWSDDTTGFAASVKDGPQIELIPSTPMEAAKS